ncbi:hypothetical protein O181_007195 [Austropuccinia psidii MF-1]|uniref:Uncharacterized protein n=1 Tax=Austropuccinia psidii MF-1 TaxID=1389203 RepID=A0A9Q3BLX0_9BASI|nr:hypothetical protein [Austropuccinia psidii MF-1]
MRIIHEEGKSHTNANFLSRLPLDNVKINTAYDPEVEAKIPIHFIEVDRRRNFIFSEWEPAGETPYSENSTQVQKKNSHIGDNLLRTLY